MEDMSLPAIQDVAANRLSQHVALAQRGQASGIRIGRPAAYRTQMV
jgi:hypothetical protein